MFLATHVHHSISDIFKIHLGDKAGDRDALNGYLGLVGESCKRAGNEVGGMWKEKELMASIGNYTRIRLQECLSVLFKTTESDD